jgi:hypothetical protein
MQLDIASPFNLTGYVFRQSGFLTAAFPVDASDADLSQPLLFWWSPDAVYSDEFFKSQPGPTRHWKQLIYSVDQLIDNSEETADPRIRRILNWLNTVWPELKQEVLTLRQDGCIGATYSKVYRPTGSSGSADAAKPWGK